MLNFGKELKIKPRKEYDKDYMRIKLGSDDNLPLNSALLKFRILTIVIRCIFERDGKYYPQIFLEYNRIDISINQMCQM